VAGAGDADRDAEQEMVCGCTGLNMQSQPAYGATHRFRAGSFTPARFVAAGGDEHDGDMGGDEEGDIDIVAKPRTRVKKPSMYKVLLLNDDYTPMDFVIDVLERFFHKSQQEATSIMWQVHLGGVGICGVYTYEVAETKVAQVMQYSVQNEHPLQCTMEKE
jgi:ATP-dependent Clp protease adaptor protein ClpS